MKLLDRFLGYVKMDTQSDDKSLTSPSTKKQLILADKLKEELIGMGLTQVKRDEFGVVYATLKKNTKKATRTIGFLAHMDTALEMSGANVKPRIIKNYDGGIITLSENPKIVLDPKESTFLKDNLKKTLIVTDGTTLLGADDKAGIAIINSFLEEIISHPEIEHGDIKIAFTPDEEIGRGVEHFDVNFFGADFAYTIDGGDIRYFNYENFNASSATVTFHGTSIHPGSAKNRMINAQLLAIEFNLLLPPLTIPQYTEGYEGFHHLVSSMGSVETSQWQYIIRNHDENKLLNQEKQFIEASEIINTKYGHLVCEVKIKTGYRNMRPLIEKQPEVITRAFQAYKKLGLEVIPTPIRGGTDGANLSSKGLLTPNLGTGAYNGHGKHEYVVLEDMLTMVKVLIEIVRVI